MKINSLLFSCALFAAMGLGIGYASQSHADPGCWADCLDARYECHAQCGTNNICKAACESQYQECRASCGL